MSRASITKAIATAIEPFVRALCADLTKLAVAELEQKLDTARAYAIDRLRADLEGKADAEKQHAGSNHGRANRRAVQRARDESDPAVRNDGDRHVGEGRSGGRDRASAANGTRESTPPAAAPDVKQPRKCRLCREVGHRADRCPNVTAPASIPTPPPPPVRIERIASRASRPQHAPVEATPDDADEEPAPVGVIQGPTRRYRPRRSRPRAMSISRKSREHGDAILGIVSGEPLHIDLDALRPRTRGDCVDGARPCPWVGCRHHFYLDVSEIGSIKLNFPELDVADLTMLIRLTPPAPVASV